MREEKKRMKENEGVEKGGEDKEEQVKLKEEVESREQGMRRRTSGSGSRE